LPWSGVEDRLEIVAAVQNDEIDTTRRPEAVATVINLAPVLALMTETDAQLEGLLPQ
jgi:hypothetical protein